MNPRIFLALGSNIAPEEHLPRALEALSGRGLALLAVSPVYRTEPLGEGYGTDPFLNAVLEVRTDLPPRSLKFEVLRPVEASLGRRTRRGPRTLDLDLVVYGGRVVREPDLRLPDPHWLERPFLAAGLAALAPDLLHPETGETAGAIARRLVRKPLAEAAALGARLRALLTRR